MKLTFVDVNHYLNIFNSKTHEHYMYNIGVFLVRCKSMLLWKYLLYYYLRRNYWATCLRILTYLLSFGKAT